MKQNYKNKFFHLAGLLFFAFTVNAQVTTFNYTGAVQTYTVPDGVGSIQIEAWGAEGGTGTYGGITPAGGLGGYAIGILEVTPGQILEVYVGGAGDSDGPGGFNGGGQSGTSYGAAGGGASDVRIGAYTLDDRVIVAGGGGGAAFGSTPSDGGHGGGLEGVAGENGDSFVGGGGGTQVAGGAAGCCYGAATGGTFGAGGGPGDYHNAGGGGGWYGGGSGAGQAGAGGGSSYIDGVTDGATTSGVREGHGQIIITVLCSPITVTVSDDVICLGESFTLEGSGLGTISWDGGVENGVPFTPATSGVFTYTASSDDGGDCVYALDIEVIALPVVVATADETEICLGESVILSGSGADTYSWDMGVTDGVAFEPGVGTEIYTVTGTDAGTGCENTDEIEVIVNDLPAVAANASDNEICLGESFTLTGSGATTYVWTPDGTLDGEEITPEATGTTTYEVTGTDDNGCVNTASTEVTVYDAISITYTTEDEMMGADGSIDITVTGGNPTYSFDWDNDGTGDFDDTEDLTGLSGGTYNVTIEDEAGCSATETIVLNSQLDIEINAEHKISIYPNPTTSHITILATGSFTYDITDVNGQILLVANGVDIKEVSLEELASGIYFVNLTIDGELTTVRVVKN
ncbi:glycine-rich protein [Crocinitomicaceae bacterium]|nr:glycine-rich protein [Crocinitomicaceae bacterium]